MEWRTKGFDVFFCHHVERTLLTRQLIKDVLISDQVLYSLGLRRMFFFNMLLVLLIPERNTSLLFNTSILVILNVRSQSLHVSRVLPRRCFVLDSLCFLNNDYTAYIFILTRGILIQLCCMRQRNLTNILQVFIQLETNILYSLL